MDITPKPQILYKYRSLSEDNFRFTRDIFIKNELYFPYPNQFNDPFDCNIFPCVKDITKEQIFKKIENIKPEKFVAMGTNLDKVKQTINNKSESELKTYLLDKYKIHQHVGVLSLSEKNLDILMWGHYADSHKGICIGFACNKLLFYFDGKPSVPFEVNYPPSNKYPEWNPLACTGEELIEKILLTKAVGWEYEQEWRIILPEKGGTSQELDPDALISVYLGCKITEQNKKTVISWCLQRKQKPKIYETRVDESSYSLKDNEIIYF